MDLPSVAVREGDKPLSELPNSHRELNKPYVEKTLEPRIRQCEPNCCPFKDFKCPITGEAKKVVFIVDIPLEERHKYIDPEQDINHPSMKVVGHCKREIVNPLETKVKEQADMINTLSSHLTEMTLQINKLTEKLFSQDKSNGK